MAYTRVNWQNSPSHATPLSAENLNVMDAGIAGLDAAVTEATGDISTLETEVGEQATTISGLQTTVGEHTADIGNMEDDISDLQTTVSGHTTSIGNLETSVEDNTSDISDLKEDLKLKADLPTETIENVPIASFTDGAEDAPVKELKIGIEPIQSGSGDPSPTNVRPISGRNSVTVTRTGKNLFDGILEQGSFSDNGEESATTSRLRTDYVVVPEGAVTLSTPTSNVYVHEVYGYDENKVFASKLSSGISAPSGTITVPSGTKYIRFSLRYVNNGTITPEGIQAQAEAGSTATTYEPYNGDSYPIPLSSTIYGGTLDVGTGVLTVDRAMVTIDGTSGISVGPASTGVKTLTYTGTIAILNYNITSNQYLMVNSPTNPGSTGIRTIANGANIYIYDDRFTDLATAQSILANNPVQAIVKVAPTTVQLTPTQVTTLLNDNNIFADSGNIVKLIYRADLGAYIEKLINA